MFLFVELMKWGHVGGLAPPPKPAKALDEKRKMEHKYKFVRWFDETFKEWGLWDNLKLVMSCILLGIAWWVS